jgi:hypothetical protein
VSECSAQQESFMGKFHRFSARLFGLGKTPEEICQPLAPQIADRYDGILTLNCVGDECIIKEALVAEKNS